MVCFTFQNTPVLSLAKVPKARLFVSRIPFANTLSASGPTSITPPLAALHQAQMSAPLTETIPLCECKQTPAHTHGAVAPPPFKPELLPHAQRTAKVLLWLILASFFSLKYLPCGNPLANLVLPSLPAPKCLTPAVKQGAVQKETLLEGILS